MKLLSRFLPPRPLLESLLALCVPALVLACGGCNVASIHSLMDDERLEAELSERFPRGLTEQQVDAGLRRAGVSRMDGWKWGNDDRPAALIALLQQPWYNLLPREGAWREVWVRFFFDETGRLTEYRFDRSGVGL